jgi:hypothetical protein
MSPELISEDESDSAWTRVRQNANVVAVSCSWRRVHHQIRQSTQGLADNFGLDCSSDREG